MRRHRVTHIPIPVDPEWARDPNVHRYGMKWVWDCEYCGAGSLVRYATPEKAWEEFCDHRQGWCPG